MFLNSPTKLEAVLRTILLCNFVLALNGMVMPRWEDESYKPRHLHLSYGASPAEVVATWSTVNASVSPVVVFGLVGGAANTTTAATMSKFVDGGRLNSTQYIYRATMTGLLSGRQYHYYVQCGSPSQSSDTFVFRTMTTGVNWSPRFAVYGDLGLVNPQSVPRLLSDVTKNMYDAVLHVGDFAYDMSSENAKVGDGFMEMIAPIASQVPYMTTPGNHEYHYNFSNYKARFTMPGGDGEGMFYSYDIGPAHIVSISTEFYFYINYGMEQLVNQYAWLKNDLQKANLPENRALHPWIILLGHRPLYCSNNNKDCYLGAEILRRGVPFTHWFGLDNILYTYGVDLSIWAHQHSYERLWPVYDDTVYNGTTILGQPYYNPRSTVHVVTGSAGCSERHDHFRIIRPYSAFRSEDYGYSRMTVVNATHLYWEQVSDDQSGAVIDKMWLIQEKHGPFVQ